MNSERLRPGLRHAVLCDDDSGYIRRYPSRARCPWDSTGQSSETFRKEPRGLLAQGERIHVALWPGFAHGDYQTMYDSIDIRCRNHAFEGKVFVISATGIISDEIKDAFCRDENDRREMPTDGGHSSIINPRGQFLAGPAGDGECILYADADLAESIDAKVVQDVLGHYNRFDIFDLRVNRKELKPITYLGEDSSEATDAPLGKGACQGS